MRMMMTTAATRASQSLSRLAPRPRCCPPASGRRHTEAEGGGRRRRGGSCPSLSTLVHGPGSVLELILGSGSGSGPAVDRITCLSLAIPCCSLLYVQMSSSSPAWGITNLMDVDSDMDIVGVQHGATRCACRLSLDDTLQVHQDGRHGAGSSCSNARQTTGWSKTKKGWVPIDFPVANMERCLSPHCSGGELEVGGGER